MIDLSSSTDRPSSSEVQAFLKSERVSDVQPLTPENHEKPDRVKRIVVEDRDTDLVFKGTRGGEQGLLDMYCDCLYADFGVLLAVPTPYQVPLHHTEIGFGVVSRRMHGEQGISVPLSEFDNADRIPALVAFEEWAMNGDDKEDHFWTIQRGEKTELRIIDHGHTIPRNPHITDPDAVSNHAEIRDPVSSKRHFFDSVVEVQKGIDVIQSVEDDEIAAVLERVTQNFRSLETDDQVLAAFLNDVDQYMKVAKTALQIRRDNIEAILTKKYDD